MSTYIRKRSHYFIFLILFYALSPSLPFAAHLTVDDTQQYQTMDGFGASTMRYLHYITNLNEPYRSQLYDLIYNDLGATILAIMIYPEFQPSNGAAYQWDTLQFQQQRSILQAALTRGTINRIWAKVSSPPGWMKDNGTSINGGQLLPAMNSTYADYLAAYVDGMRTNYGIDIELLSIFNEPGVATTYESTETTPENYRDTLKTVSATFATNGLVTKFMGPETVSISVPTVGTLAGFYAQTILADEQARQALDVISTHQYYDWTGTDNWDGLKNLASFYNKSIWETESSWTTAASYDITDGLTMAWLMWRAITLGNATAWHYWSYHWPKSADPLITFPGSSMGLIYIPDTNSYSMTKLYYCFKQWSKPIRPGNIRLSALSDDPNLQIAAFTSDTTIQLIVLNRTASDINSNFTVPAIQGPITHIRTSATENYSTLSDLSPISDSFTSNIQSYSLNSYIIPKAVMATATPTLAATLNPTLTPTSTPTITELARNKLLIASTNDKDVLQLSLNFKGSGELKVTILNIAGEIVLRTRATVQARDNRATTTLSTHELAPGLYIAHIIAKDSIDARHLQNKLVVLK